MLPLQEHLSFEISLCGKLSWPAPVCSQICLTNHRSSPKMSIRLLPQRRTDQEKFICVLGQPHSLDNATKSLLKEISSSLYLFPKINPGSAELVSKEMALLQISHRYDTICSLASFWRISSNLGENILNLSKEITRDYFRLGLLQVRLFIPVQYRLLRWRRFLRDMSHRWVVAAASWQKMLVWWYSISGWPGVCLCLL